MASAPSVFTNPAGGTAADAAAYTQALLDLLDDRDPMAVLRAQPAALRAAVEGLSAHALRRQEAPGKWSIVEVVQHLADTELVYGYRLRMMVAHDDPPIQGYDQDRWAGRLHYRDVDPGDALEQHDVLRRANLRFLDGLTPAEWERSGLHSERGPESVRHVVRLVAAHDLLHLRQIDRIRRALSSTPETAPS